MSWATIIAAIVKLVAFASEFMGRKQLLDAGKAEAIAQGLRETLENLERADNAKTEVESNPAGIYAKRVRDKYTRTE